jgi:uncharacterized short protein YbdD (DUF466 family)
MSDLYAVTFAGIVVAVLGTESEADTEVEKMREKHPDAEFTVEVM